MNLQIRVSPLSEDKRFEEINKHYMKSSKLTVWNWMIFIPLGVLCVWFLLKEHTNFNIPELNSSSALLFFLLSIFSFGLLMSIIGDAKKGRVRMYFRLGRRRRMNLIKREDSPILFFLVTSVHLILAFVFCSSMIYLFLSNLF